MDNLRRLEEIFAHFPGIGPRQARRFVYYILSRPAATVKELAQLLEEVKRNSGECSLCHRLMISSKSADAICSICSDKNRDQSKLLVVARDSDFESIEKSGAYQGLYFILGGTVPILDKEPEKRIRLKLLLERLHDSAQIKEVILSLNTTPDGEHTAMIVKEAISTLYRDAEPNNKPAVSLLGRGLSTGAELEYADSETIKNALQNRH